MADFFIVQAMPTCQDIPAGNSKPVRIPSGKKIQVTCVDPNASGNVRFICNGVHYISYPQGIPPYPQYNFPDEIGVFLNDPILGPNPPATVTISAVD
ncbi:MAG: hypothetical protein V1779_16115 [bacterium]